MTWWALFLCWSSLYDYTAEIAAAGDGRYCSDSVMGVATVVDVTKAENPPVTVAEVSGWDLDPFPTYYIVTYANRQDEEFCAEPPVRYWVGCIDWAPSWVSEEQQRCLHQCHLLRIIREGEE